MAKLVIVSLAALVTYGFAATLGSGSAALDAGSKVIASCGNGMTFAYTSAYETDSGYVVDGIDLSGIPAGCRNKTLSATFYDRRGATVGSTVGATLTASGSTQSIAIAPTTNTIDAGRVSGVSVVVS
jgi:hypothetical protein